MRLSSGRNDDPLSELSGASLSSCKSFGDQVSHLPSCCFLFHAGVTLWDCNSIQKDLNVNFQLKTESEIIAFDSIDDKASALGISASLKASFLGAGLKWKGQPTIFKSKKQARVTVWYKTTTMNEQLTMSCLGIQNVSYPAIFEQGTATHVVTAILYGAQAFFVFDREVSSMEMVKDIQGNLQLTVKKLLSIPGELWVKLTEKEKENALRFRCTFHGDFSLERNPVTFKMRDSL
ncbi:putative Neoverrucotoxin subunit beta protein [Naja naja]|nr:putative Neoverrucotoxin subunit beta protein [Naja naja]